MAQKANNYLVMAKYSGANFGKLRDRFSLILRKILKKKKSLLLPDPWLLTTPLKKMYSEEYYMDVLSETK